jgi:6-pyruvoyltetrahydropterin/6-carboxytetrahydropterin synthase
MYSIKVISHFSAAHSLRGHKGKCEKLHGHNWKIEVILSAQKLNTLGMVMDFSDLKKIIKQVLDGLDHKYLNDLNYFQKINPSSEEIARYIFEKLKKIIPGRQCHLRKVKVWETDSACALYTEDKQS